MMDRSASLSCLVLLFAASVVPAGAQTTGTTTTTIAPATTTTVRATTTTTTTLPPDPPELKCQRRATRAARKAVLAFADCRFDGLGSEDPLGAVGCEEAAIQTLLAGLPDKASGCPACVTDERGTIESDPSCTQSAGEISAILPPLCSMFVEALTRCETSPDVNPRKPRKCEKRLRNHEQTLTKRIVNCAIRRVNDDVDAVGEQTCIDDAKKKFVAKRGKEKPLCRNCYGDAEAIADQLETTTRLIARATFCGCSTGLGSCDTECGTCANDACQARDDVETCGNANVFCDMGRCADGVCELLNVGKECDDGDSNVCTSGRCSDEGVCAPTNNDTVCDDRDDNPCTEGRCTDGECKPAPVTEEPLPDCDDDDGKQCTQGRCDENGACVARNEPDGTACDDGDPCNGDGATDSCEAGECMPDPDACGRIIDQCMQYVCNPPSDCGMRARVGEDCGDGRGCTIGSCNLRGECEQETISCADGNDCTRDECLDIPGEPDGYLCRHLCRTDVCSLDECELGAP